MNLNFLFKHRINKGSMLIEVIIATALISILMLALVSVTQKSLELSERSLKQIQASFLLEEGVEAVKTVRDNSWTNISSVTTGSNQYLSFNTGTNTWSLSSTPDTIDNVFTRTIVLDSVYRDGTDDIASSGTIDPNTKKVTVNVSWLSSVGTINKSISFYIVDLFN